MDPTKSGHKPLTDAQKQPKSPGATEYSEKDTVPTSTEPGLKDSMSITPKEEALEPSDRKPDEETFETKIPNYPQGIKLITIILALCFAVFLVALDQTIISTAIPRITTRFQSVDDIGWYSSPPTHFLSFDACSIMLISVVGTAQATWSPRPHYSQVLDEYILCSVWVLA